MKFDLEYLNDFQTFNKTLNKFMIMDQCNQNIVLVYFNSSSGMSQSSKLNIIKFKTNFNVI
jgi:hypothetical protein